MWYTGAYSVRRRFRDLLRGRDVQELKELQRQGMSIQAISKLTGWDRKTIRKYMQTAGLAPEYGPRSAPPSKLDAFKPYLEQRLHDSDGLVAAATQRGTSGGRATLRDGSGQAGASGLGTSGHAGAGRARTEAARFHLHAGLQPQDGSGSGVGPKAGHATAPARSSVPADRRRTGRNSLRPHEDGVAGDGRAGGDRLAPGVSGLRALLGIHATVVPAVSRTDERESGSGREVCAAELSVWLARARTRQPERSECTVARVDLGCREPTRARNNA